LSQLATLRRIVEALGEAGVPYMLAGSHASTFHGAPRTTLDIDLVIDPDPATLGRFLASLPPAEFYVSAAAARDALARRGAFNVVDLETGWKVDLIIRKDRAFSREEFARREATAVFGTPIFVATAEDTILAKLEWAKLGESERQLRDVAGVLAVRGPGLDRVYLERWVAALGLADAWRRAQELAEGSE